MLAASVSSGRISVTPHSAFHSSMRRCVLSCPLCRSNTTSTWAMATDEHHTPHRARQQAVKQSWHDQKRYAAVSINCRDSETADKKRNNMRTYSSSMPRAVSGIVMPRSRRICWVHSWLSYSSKLGSICCCARPMPKSFRARHLHGKTSRGSFS